MALFKKVAEQTVQQLHQNQRILTAAKGQGVDESDTVAVVDDLLSDVLGSPEYIEIVTRFPVRGTHVDKDSDLLLEAQAIGAAR